MTTPTRRAALASAAASLALAATARRAMAQAAWPARTIRLIVPVSPGGSQDVVARAWARAVGERIGQTITVENVPGRGSTIGYAAAARSPADGHTLLAGADSLSIVGTLAPRLGFDPLGFAPVHRSVRVPQILVVRADHDAATLSDWLARARRKGVHVGTPGTGQLSHLLTAQLAAEAGVELTHVSYRGGPLALNDLLPGHLDAVMINNRRRHRPCRRRQAARACRQPGAPRRRPARGADLRGKRLRGSHGGRLAWHRRAGGNGADDPRAAQRREPRGAEGAGARRPSRRPRRRADR